MGIELDAETYYQLRTIDFQSVRPLRAILAGMATEEDYAKLRELEEQAEKLRGTEEETKSSNKGIIKYNEDTNELTVFDETINLKGSSASSNGSNLKGSVSGTVLTLEIV